MARVRTGHKTDIETGAQVAEVYDASPEDVATVLAADPDGDWGMVRSQWVWVWLPNGDLILGVFPQDDAFFATEVGRSDAYQAHLAREEARGKGLS